MNIFKNIFGRKKENPFLIIFRQVSPKNFDFDNSNLYHIKSFEYTNENMQAFDKNIKKKNLYDILNKLNYNSQSNNVSVYYSSNSESQNKIYLVSDPLELYEKEYIMEEYEINLDQKVMSLSTVEKIW